MMINISLARNFKYISINYIVAQETCKLFLLCYAQYIIFITKIYQTCFI